MSLEELNRAEYVRVLGLLGRVRDFLLDEHGNGSAVVMVEEIIDTIKGTVEREGE